MDKDKKAQEILLKLQELFFKKLEEKNSWGKNEVKELYKQCKIEVLISVI